MSQGKFSLKRQLLLWLLFPQLVLWLAGAFLSYQVATHYANAVIDNSLLQTARAVARQAGPQGHGQAGDLARIIPLLIDDNPDDALVYSVWTEPGKPIAGNAALPPPPDSVQTAGQPSFYTADGTHGSLRLVSLIEQINNGPQLHVQIGRTFNSQLYREILVATALPLGVLIIAMSVLVWWGIERGLLPLTRLQRLVGNRSAQDLAPLELVDAPQEVHAISNALNQLLSTTNESISRQRRFIADAAHQLRTPLAGLKSQTELALRETSPDTLRDRLNMVHASATRSIHLVNQLLTLARSEPGSTNGMPTVRVDLAKLMRELTAECVPRSLAAGMDLGCDTSLSSAVIDGNPALLRELFINLIENAIKYIPRGGSITARLEEDDKNYIVDVEDDGNGIPDEQKPRVFERFFRVNQNEGNGCGLGMAIVKEIAERHGGSVELRDAQPHGLIVHVVLPKSR
ncbi:two-component system, OmpR family, sensor histidine kinase TctE [Andreprevotia lacus DSM 23236]|jgi:two-component system sensor histidine kinase TctE|uniref:histidine kinase n=1 Tax=Andreprevotia lacus DSM 23236 TaxID=1121001 RepID=A0A1W1XYI1_9NEIS|nr:sensor histidine kinase [Andreprevotia lacus]SMC28907.1 two-component system, OmpR family, sensor histidine kinase TctE [Andreprevotia lacus DSM 23236]